MVSRRQLLKLSALGTATFAAPLAYSASNITMTHKNGSPLGSPSLKDADDNARSLDLLVCGDSPTYMDRRGVQRRSWAGMEGEFSAEQERRRDEFNKLMDATGFEPPVVYASGIRLERTTQTVTYQGNDYRVKNQCLPLTTTTWEQDEESLKLVGDYSLRHDLASPTGTENVRWLDPVSPNYLKTISDMKLGEPVNLFRLIPREEHSGISSGISTYDCAQVVNEADELFHATSSKGGLLQIPRGRVMASDLTFRGGFTMQGEGHSVSEIILADSACIKLSGVNNRLVSVHLHKHTPKGNYVTAGDMSNAGEVAGLTSIKGCKFTAEKFDEFVNYALVGNYRSCGIELIDNVMYTYHLAFITKYLTSEWVRLVGNQVYAMSAEGVFNSELFKIEAVTKGLISHNLLRSIDVPNTLACLTLESGAFNVLVHNNVIETNHGYGVRIEDSDKTIDAPTNCALSNNTIIAKGEALAIYSGNSACDGLSISGGHITGPVTLYGRNTSLIDVKLKSLPGDDRTGITLRGDRVRVHDNEITGFGKGLVNAALAADPDHDLSIRRNVFYDQVGESVSLKYLTGKCFLEGNVINNQAVAKGAIYLMGGGEPALDSTLVVKDNSVLSPNMPGITVEYMNGVKMLRCGDVVSPIRYDLISTDAYVEDEQSLSAENFSDKNHRINNIAKFRGKQVFGREIIKPCFAAGALPEDVWVDAAGVVIYSPS